MTRDQAVAYVRSHSDDDEIAYVDLRDAFYAIFERMPDRADAEEGIWSHLCASVADDDEGAA